MGHDLPWVWGLGAKVENRNGGTRLFIFTAVCCQICLLKRTRIKSLLHGFASTVTVLQTTLNFSYGESFAVTYVFQCEERVLFAIPSSVTKCMRKLFVEFFSVFSLLQVYAITTPYMSYKLEIDILITTLGSSVIQLCMFRSYLNSVVGNSTVYSGLFDRHLLCFGKNTVNVNHPYCTVWFVCFAEC